jgi:hypothetical protein
LRENRRGVPVVNNCCRITYELGSRKFNCDPENGSFVVKQLYVVFMNHSTDMAKVKFVDKTILDRIKVILFIDDSWLETEIIGLAENHNQVAD